ncbi:hypothetical protein BOTBODRAFT_173516 [Botryobasidium botryosum FD-172 SS1]|uniref:Uncharacterized protein n=1 Tax=Botryobasidium botryosum (strain FD-172 SS1) TaxID=930990 RepID=A0A067MJZ8_BOTB1|nr:hypothetical protein BOTBODRAFT_173516 [Botryobasidium botryosum FD-172 SS1]
MYGPSLEPFCSFIQRSNPPLRSFFLETVMHSDADLIHCFEAMPSLENLGLHACPISDAVLRALAGYPHDEARQGAQDSVAPKRLLPLLVELDLKDNFSLTNSEIVRFFNARNGETLLSSPSQAASPRRITRARVCVNHTDQADIDVLQALGVEVSSEHDLCI